MKKVWWIIITVFVLLILSGAIFYFTQVNNIFAKKNELVKPDVDLDLLLEDPSAQIIQEVHVEYIANEMGAYKLHSSSSEAAVIVFEMTDIDKEIAFVKDDDDAYATEDIPENYDLVIKSTQLIVAEIIGSEEVSDAIVENVQTGEIEVEIISDETTLALKGFLAVYEEIMG
jgi:uncharacterized protein YxeA